MDGDYDDCEGANGRYDGMKSYRAGADRLPRRECRMGDIAPEAGCQHGKLSAAAENALNGGQAGCMRRGSIDGVQTHKLASV